MRDAIVGNKQAAADRYGILWRAVDNACTRLAEEALGRVDLLDGVVAVAIDEVKYKKGHRYLTVVCDHFTGPVLRTAFAAFADDHPPASVARARSTWTSLFDLLVADGHLDGSPMAAVPRTKQAPCAPNRSWVATVTPRARRRAINDLVVIGPTTRRG